MTSDQRRVLIADEHFTAGHLQLAESLCIELWEEMIRSPMLIGNFRLEHQFGFHIGGLLGDGFVNTGALTLGFGAMRLALEQ